MKNTRRPLIVITMALLLTVVMVMSCVTFAKYVSTDSIKTTSASVAKWGWKLSANAENLFNNNYGDVSENLAKVTAGEDGVVFTATADTELVAPGTTGSMTFSIQGSAEVKTAITVDTTGSACNIQLAGETTYEPIVWTLTRTNASDEAKNGTVATGDFATVIAAIDGLDETVEATDKAANQGDYTLTWAWAFSTEGNDVKDTELGVNANDTTPATVTLALAITVTQVQ